MTLRDRTSGVIARDTETDGVVGATPASGLALAFGPDFLRFSVSEEEGERRCLTRGPRFRIQGVLPQAVGLPSTATTEQLCGSVFSDWRGIDSLRSSQGPLRRRHTSSSTILLWEGAEDGGRGRLTHRAPSHLDASPGEGFLSLLPSVFVSLRSFRLTVLAHGSPPLEPRGGDTGVDSGSLRGWPNRPGSQLGPPREHELSGTPFRTSLMAA